MPNYPQVQGHPHNEHHSDEGGENWALVATLIQTAKLNGVDPQAWLTDVLERIVARQVKATDLHRLLPWNWKATVPEKAATQAA
jgi:transposase